MLTVFTLFARRQTISDDQRWQPFLAKLAKWVCLCECFPYRISFLVLVVEDFMQKALVNKLKATHPNRAEYELVQYKPSGVAEANNTAGAAQAGSVLDRQAPDHLDPDMPIVTAFYKYVERYIYSHKMARNFLALDCDAVRETL